MKLYEYKLVNFKIYKDGELVYDGSSNDLPEEYKMCESKKVSLESGFVVVEI